MSSDSRFVYCQRLLVAHALHAAKRDVVSIVLGLLLLEHRHHEGLKLIREFARFFERSGSRYQRLPGPQIRMILLSLQVAHPALEDLRVEMILFRSGS